MSSAILLPFDYKVKRSRRKTIGIYVKDQAVEVRAPYHAAEDEILSWLKEKSDWVEKHLREQEIQATEKPDISHGGSFLFLGKQRSIEYIDGPPAVYEKDDHFIIARRSNTNITKLFETWLRTEAELYLIDRTHEWADTMQETHRLNGVTFRKTYSKWGHCTSEGILQFNWLVIMAPPEVIDYLIIHELSHLEHMNHSKAFWSRVESFCPNYKAERKWLNDNAHKLRL